MKEPTRPLTTQEQLELLELEKEILIDDPALAAALTGDDVPPNASEERGSRLKISKDLVLLVLADLVGLVTLSVGVIAGSPVVGLCGFAAAVVAASMLLGRDEVRTRLQSLLRDLTNDRAAPS